jgi:hypothetical protein
MNVACLLCALIFQFYTADPLSTTEDFYPALTGKWKGVLTQQEGGYKKNYEFYVEIQLDGDQIIGRSQVEIDELFAQMKIKGRLLTAKSLEFSEIQILDMEKQPGMDWCFKHCILQLERIGDSWRLKGEWSGFSEYGSCTPGQIFLRKLRPRA